MIIGVCGAPFTGKSKLAKELAKRMKYGLQAYEFELFYENENLKSETCGNLIERLKIQSEIINTMCIRLNEIVEDDIIFDATPLDAFSYLLADFSSQNLTPLRQNKKTANFVHHAITGMRQEIIKAMMSKFEFLVVCQSRDLTKGAYDRMSFNQDLKHHIGYITNGILATLPLNSIFLTDDKADFNKDVEFVLKHIEKISETQKKTIAENGITVN